MKTQINVVKANPIGAVVVAGAAFYAAKKYGKVSNKFALVGIAVAGLVIGAHLQAKVVAKKSTPTKETVKK